MAWPCRLPNTSMTTLTALSWDVDVSSSSSLKPILRFNREIKRSLRLRVAKRLWELRIHQRSWHEAFGFLPPFHSLPCTLCTSEEQRLENDSKADLHSAFHWILAHLVAALRSRPTSRKGNLISGWTSIPKHLFFATVFVGSAPSHKIHQVWVCWRQKALLHHMGTQ